MILAAAMTFLANAGLTPHGVWLYAVLGHIFVYFIVVAWSVYRLAPNQTETGAGLPAEASAVLSYYDMKEERGREGRSVDFFNSNPILCLRSKFLKDYPYDFDPNGVTKIRAYEVDSSLTWREKMKNTKIHMNMLWKERGVAGDARVDFSSKNSS